MSHKRVQLTCEDASKTKQSFIDECDVNKIMEKWRKTGEMNHLNERQPTYGDFSTGVDYLAARQAVIDAEADFNALSARVRDRMNNDPAEFLRFVSDPENLQEGIELGLIEKPASTSPDTAPVPAAGTVETVADPPQLPARTPVAGGE